MKYIRTKDGKIYDLESKEVSSWEYIDNDTAIDEYGVEGAFYTIYYFDENEGHYSEYDGKSGHSCDFIEEKDILNRADTIEELCDGIIEKCWSGNRFHYIYDFNKQEAIKVMNIDINKGYKEFYFGIFVEYNNKIDFISVAKMNDEGKLCLI